MVSNKLNISAADRELFDKIQSGDKDAIIKGLVHPGAIYKVNAAINAVRYDVKELSMKIHLDRMKEDDRVVNGYRTSDFAYAALELLGMEHYFNNEPRVKMLIQSKFDFF